MKLGLDIHGVIDNKPEFFSELSHILVNSLNEVHIITGGSLRNGEIEKELARMNIVYTHIFSVYDYLQKTGAKTNEELGIASRYPFPDETWNSVKARYCEREDVDMHIDDMAEYLRYFTTPYMLHKDDSRNHRGQFGTHRDKE